MKKRTFKKIIGLMLSMVLLIVPCSNTAIALDEQISTGDTVSQTTEYSSGNWIEADAIIPNPDYVTSESTLTQRTETAENLSTTSGVLADGVYRIKNVANGKYMDTNGGGTTAGTAIVQWDKSEYINGDADVPNRNQLFKVTYLGTSNSKDYYSIRPMTNNGMGVSAPKTSTTDKVDIQKMATSESINNIYNYQKWIIALDGNHYTL